MPKADEGARKINAPAMLAVLSFVLLASPLFAQCVAVTQSGTIVAAHDGFVDLYDADGQKRIWRANGLPYASAIAIGEKDVAVLDPIDNRAVIVDLETGAPRPLRTAETPIAAVFAGRDLYVLDRDARIVERIAATGGARATVALDADPSFMRPLDGKLYVYSRTTGALQEITLSPFAVSRTVTVLPFASGLEVAKLFAYVVYPAGQRDSLKRLPPGPSQAELSQFAARRGSVLTVDLASMKPASNGTIGAVPVGITLFGGDILAAPVIVAIADPVAKSVWVVDGVQSEKQAFARGFIRGLIGLGSVDTDHVSFESGVDRVSINGSHRLAYDTATGTLYRFSNKDSSVVARGVGPNAFAATPTGFAWWQNGTLVAQKENR